MTERRNDWLSPPMLLAYVSMLAAFGGFWQSFDSRVTKAESSIESLTEALQDHRSTEAMRLNRIEDKIDRLIERKENK